MHGISLPYKKKPLDLYRAPMWHAEYDFEWNTYSASIKINKRNWMSINDVEIFV